MDGAQHGEAGGFARVPAGDRGKEVFAVRGGGAAVRAAGAGDERRERGGGVGEIPEGMPPMSYELRVTNYELGNPRADGAVFLC